MPRKGAATAAVAAGLYRHLSVTPGNLLFSPYSVSTALAMAQAGAAGNTRQEIEASLECSGSGDSLIELFGELASELGSRSRPAPHRVHLSVANAFWCQAGYPVQPTFVETLRDRLGAEVLEADFAGGQAEAARQVNAWVAGATHDKIREIIAASQIDPLTRVVLANAIYFKARWLEPFEEEATTTEPFHLLDGARLDVPMMHTTSYYQYARDGRLQALQLPYGNRRTAMIVLLPDEGKLVAAEREFDAGRLDGVIRKMKSVRVDLSLPRFRVESSFELRSPLTKLGIVAAFGPQADFSRISAEPGFALSKVLHKTFVDVVEWGTEAAAATVEMMLGAAMSPPRPIVFRVDRPFLFVIRDGPTGSVLFIGRVVDPSR